MRQDGKLQTSEWMLQQQQQTEKAKKNWGLVKTMLRAAKMFSADTNVGDDELGDEGEEP